MSDWIKNVLGIPMRSPYTSEHAFFQSNPSVAGMAAEDDAVVLNPYSTIDADERHAVAQNEAYRVMLRNGLLPRNDFALSPAQQSIFRGYGSPQDIQDTITARMLSGDPSAQAPTIEQQQYVDNLRNMLMDRMRKQ